MKISIQSLGCKINQFDAGALREKLVAGGALPAANGEVADVKVIYTCTVTGRSDYQCRQAIRRAVAEKPEGGIVVVAGCYAETNPTEITGIPGVDYIVGNRSSGDVAGIILKSTQPVSSPGMSAQGLEGRSRAFLKVQDGCNAFCSYCIVPYARGRARSAHTEDVIYQAERLIAAGYREIVLTGVQLGVYRDGEIKVADLMERLLTLPGLGRLRLSSIEPKELDERLLELLASEKACRHLHIPMQSGDDQVLTSMGRGYTAAEYFRLVDKVYQRIPEACIGADVIVGYPAEDIASFERTYKAIEDSPLNHLHVFSYSPRRGTKAGDTMADKVRGDEKKARSGRLRALSAGKNRVFREAHLGRDMDIVGEMKNGKVSGLTDNYIRVYLDGAAPAKELVRVRLVGMTEDGCEGVVSPKT